MENMTLSNVLIKDRKRLVERLKEAELPTRRFLRLRNKTKIACESEWYDRLYTIEEIENESSIGVSGGNGLLLMDVDNPEFAKKIEEMFKPTFTVKSGGKGLPHLFFKVDGQLPQNQNLVYPSGSKNHAGEIRTFHYYTVAPGSHIDYYDENKAKRIVGNYTILNDLPIAQIKYNEFLDKILPYYEHGEEGDKLTLEDIEKGVTEGNRNSKGLKVANLLIAKESNLDEAKQKFVAWNQKCVPPLDQKELDDLFNNALNYQSKPETQAKYAEKKKDVFVLNKENKKQNEPVPVIVDLGKEYYLIENEETCYLIEPDGKPKDCCNKESVAGPRFRKKLIERTKLSPEIITEKTTYFKLLTTTEETQEPINPNESEKKDKKQQKRSAGLYQDGTIFEQIEGNKYVYGKEGKQLEIIELDDIFYSPYEKTPWKVANQLTPFEGLDILRREIKTFIKAHLFVMEQAHYDILTSWIIASWVQECWTVVPYIFFYGPINSGKTRGLEILNTLSFRGLLASNISTASLYRATETWHPTLILDETETYTKEKKAEVFGILNSGYRRGQYAIRVKDDQDKTVETFDVFGLKALAGTYSLKNSTESRCIIVNTIKAGKNNLKKILDEEWALKLRNKLLGFRFDMLDNVRRFAVYDVLPEGSAYDSVSFLSGREMELFGCLIAVAGEDLETIISFAKKFSENKASEERASVEAEIAQILGQEGMINDKDFVLTDNITNKLNENRKQQEAFSNRSVGWIMRKLGFKSDRVGSLRGWIISSVRLNNILKIYGMEETKNNNGDAPEVKRRKRQNGVQFENIDDLESYFEPEEEIVCNCFDCSKPLTHHEVCTWNTKPYCRECRLKIEAQKKQECPQ